MSKWKILSNMKSKQERRHWGRVAQIEVWCRGREAHPPLLWEEGNTGWTALAFDIVSLYPVEEPNIGVNLSDQ